MVNCAIQFVLTNRRSCDGSLDPQYVQGKHKFRTKGQWIPRFKYRAQHLCFFVFCLSLHVEEQESKSKKRPSLVHTQKLNGHNISHFNIHSEFYFYMFHFIFNLEVIFHPQRCSGKDLFGPQSGLHLCRVLYSISKLLFLPISSLFFT